MLLVHGASHRAGFALEWHKTHKADYLAALAQEINAPGQGILDAYLRPFTGPQLARSAWGDNILTVKGLDGLDGENQLDGNLDDPAVAQRYRQLEERRAYACIQPLCQRRRRSSAPMAHRHRPASMPA